MKYLRFWKYLPFWNWVNYWWHIRGLWDKLERAEDREYRGKAEARTKRMTGEERRNLDYNLYAWVQYAEEDLRINLTENLSSEARRKMVPVPPRPNEGDDSEMWEQTQFVVNGHWNFTDLGMQAVRRGLVEEQAARQDPRFKWGGLIFGLLGTIGALLAILGVEI